MEHKVKNIFCQVNLETTEYGFPYFGVHYGKKYFLDKKSLQIGKTNRTIPVYKSGLGVAVYKKKMAKNLNTERQSFDIEIKKTRPLVTLSFHEISIKKYCKNISWPISNIS